MKHKKGAAFYVFLGIVFSIVYIILAAEPLAKEHQFIPQWKLDVNAQMEKADASFIKGNTVTLNGEKAEKFLRFRDTNKDFSAITRIEAHKEYLRAYQMKLKQFKGDSIVEKILSLNYSPQ